LTGRRPFPGDSFEEQISGHLTTPPPQPSTTAPDISPAFDAVIARGLAKDLEGRRPSGTRWRPRRARRRTLKRC
jgi:hypothetical protein